MKIAVNRITAEGIKVDQTINPEDIDLSSEDSGVQSKITVLGTAQRVSEFVIVNVVLEAKHKLTCGRCLEEFESEASDKCTFDYEIERGMEVIDVGEDIRQEMVVRHAPWLSCEIDDKGVCSFCGENVEEKIKKLRQR